MTERVQRAGVGLALVAAAALVASRPSRAASAFPDPTVDIPLAAGAGSDTAVFAGGCFWGVEAVYEHTRGVLDSVSGYAGGSRKNANYEAVGRGDTGHAESVMVTFDPARISYGQLLKVFFAVAHDPTQLNRQGPDSGPQYRSAIFFKDENQARIARGYIAQLDAARQFKQRIVTEVVPLREFYPAEPYHQNYMAKHPGDLYIMINDRPKVYELQREYPALYVESRQR
jgi:peptide-methionine (S)-S-oxide reductase